MSEGRGVRQEVHGAAGEGRTGGQAAGRHRRLSARPALAVVADLRAGEGRQLSHPSLVDRLAAWLLAAADQHQHPGSSRLRARDHADADRERRVRHHLQRVLRDRSSHHDRQDLRHRPEASRGRSAPRRREVGHDRRNRHRRRRQDRRISHLPVYRPQGRRRGAVADQGECGRCGGVSRASAA